MKTLLAIIKSIHVYNSKMSVFDINKGIGSKNGKMKFRVVINSGESPMVQFLSQSCTFKYANVKQLDFRQWCCWTSIQ